MNWNAFALTKSERKLVAFLLCLLLAGALIGLARNKTPWTKPPESSISK